MAALVIHDTVAGPHKGAHPADIGPGPRTEQDRIFEALQLRERSLERSVRKAAAVEQHRSRETHGECLDCLDSRLLHPRVVRQTKIVIRAEHQCPMFAREMWRGYIG